MKANIKAEPIATVYRTKDASIFKKLEGNRDVGSRAAKIAKKIKEIGYIMCPIIVNEKYEVIDGAGRLGALTALKLPVDFIVVPGLTLEHCVAMNQGQTNWTPGDFVNSFAEQGKKDYVRFRDTVEKFNIAPSTCHIIFRTSATCTETGGAKVLEQGRLKYTEQDQRELEQILSKIQRCDQLLKEIGGRYVTGKQILAFIFRNFDIDVSEFIRVVKLNMDKMYPIGSFASGLKSFEDAYNLRRRTKVYFVHKYETMRDEAMARARKKG